MSGVCRLLWSIGPGGYHMLSSQSMYHNLYRGLWTINIHVNNLFEFLYMLIGGRDLFLVW